MPVSEGLQRHFDKTWSGKKQVCQKLDDLQWKIDPAFLRTFEAFRDKLLDIVEDTPESCSVAENQIDTLGTKLEQVNNKRKVKTFEAVIDNV